MTSHRAATDMGVNLHFDHPEFLLLALLAIPLAVVGWRALRTSDRFRRGVIVFLRILVLTLAAVVLAGPRHVREHNQITVIGLIDISGSIQRFAELPEIEDLGRVSNLEYLRWWFREATGERAPDDRLGLVVFDGRAIALIAPTRAEGVDFPIDISIRDGTNIADAIRLGLAMFPADTARRLVLISDGNETMGDALAAAREAAGYGGAAGTGGVPIDVLPVAYRVDNDVQVVRIEVPQTARPEQVVNVRVVLESIQPTAGTLTLTLEGRPIDLSPGIPGAGRPIDVPAGRSVQIFPVMLHDAVVNRIEAIFTPDDPAADQLIENNRATAFVSTPSRGRVLVVRNENSNDDPTLERTLAAAGLPVEARHPGELPTDLLQLQVFDLIILQNIAAYEMHEQMHTALARYVHDFGGGLIMLGGERSFGAGGWNGTDLEDVLPVELDLPREMRLTEAALVLVIDKSGSMAAPVAGTRMTQQEVANEGAARAIESLQQDSLIAVIAFDLVPSTVIPLGPNDDPVATSRRVRSIMPGGGTNIVPALDRAAEMLRGVDVRNKYIICLSDGVTMGSESFVAMSRELYEREGMVISTIAVGDEADALTLKRAAEVGGGKFYDVINPEMLPRVLVDSVQIINRPLIREVRFQPHVRATGSTLTAGMVDAPPLEGFVLTAHRDDPRIAMEMLGPEGEPLLAHWQAGLGRAAAFTSDAHLDWSRHWGDWPGYGTFFAQLARQTARSPVPQQFELNTVIDADRMHITLHAMADEGGTLDHLVVQGRVFSPLGEASPVRLSQVAPGRYAATVPVDEAGNYVVALTPQQGGRPMAPVIGGVSRAGGAEFRRYQSNIALLQRIAEETGGRLLDLEEPRRIDLFERSGMARSVSMLPAWRGFLYLLVTMFLLDVAARRIAWSSDSLRRSAAMALARVTGRGRKAEEARLTLASLRRRADEFDQTVEAGSRGVKKLEGDPLLRIPSHLREREITEQEREAAIAEALRRVGGRADDGSPMSSSTKDDQSARTEQPRPASDERGEHEDEADRADQPSTASGLLAAKRRASERFGRSE